MGRAEAGRRRVHLHVSVRGDNLAVDHLHPRLCGRLYSILVLGVALWLVLDVVGVVF